MDLIPELEKYKAWNEQEEADRLEILRRLKSGEELYLRNNLSAHLTASAWVISPDGKQVLMVYHNLYRSWSWLGGHADGEKDLLSVAVREVKEESGIKNAKPVSLEIFSVEILTVDGHEKKGRYMPSHLHLNVTYLIEADPGEKLSVKSDENSNVGWFGLEDAVAASTEPWFRERIYSKLNAKLLKYLHQ